MKGVFNKSILRVGRYHSPDGIVDVTPRRLRHWATGFRKLQSVGYAVPSHFDHGSTLEDLEPVEMSVLEESPDRSASKTVGRMAAFDVSNDGKSAEIVFETLTKTAKEAVESNAVYVSPVIFPEWKDGAGNVHQDVITSLDLVDHPVDHSQSSFVPATRMGLPTVPAIRLGINTQPFRLSSMQDDEHEELDETLEVDGSDEDADDGLGELSDDGLGDEIETEPILETPEITPPVGDEMNAQMLSDVLTALQGMSIVLPPDTAPGNFLDRLHTALLTAAAHQDGAGAGMGGEMGEGAPEAASPMIATMSTQARGALEFARKTHAQSLEKRIAVCLKRGQCEPHEAQKQKKLLAATKLSLSSSGQAKPCSVSEWLKSRESVPEGTFFSTEQKTAAAQRLSTAPQPSQWAGNGDISQKEIDEAVERLAPLD